MWFCWFSRNPSPPCPRKATEALKATRADLKSIAHLLPAEVDRVLYSEAEAINTAIVDNWQAAAEVKAKLLSQEVHKEQLTHRVWQQAVEAWRRHASERLLVESLQRLDTDAHYEPEFQRLLGLLGQEQQVLKRRCASLIAELASLLPENAILTFCASFQRWTGSCDDLAAKITETHAAYLNKLDELNAATGQKVGGSRGCFFSLA